MTEKNAFEYPQNYDVVVKWLAETLRGQTLEAIGVETGLIVDVFGFEPVDISVKTGRVDVMFRDDSDKYFHLEEQRNLKKKDLYRFAAHHFMGAEKWEEIKMLDILEIAHEKGKKEGIEKGIEEGKALGILETAREMLFDVLAEKFDVVPKSVLDGIRKIDDAEILKVLFRKVFRCDEIEQFENLLARY